ncbi:MAG: reverse transcriptase-like protein [Armatimonadota bacterium]|jgi:ribonuclease HI
MAAQAGDTGTTRVYALTSVAARSGVSEAGIGVILRDRSRATLKQVSTKLEVASPEAARHQAVMRALRDGLELGARSITVFTDDTAVVGYLNRDLEVPADLVSTYLEARSLMNQYRYAAVRLIEDARNAKARTLAERGLESDAAEVREYRTPELPLER